MYLPRRIYELLPYAYVVVGMLACSFSYLGTGAGWSDGAFAIGALAVIAGLVLILRRRSYRDDAARYDSHSLDDQ